MRELSCNLAFDSTADCLTAWRTAHASRVCVLLGSCSSAQDDAVLARARENGVAILEANVGLLLAVSKGEIVGRVDRSGENSKGAQGAPAVILLSSIEIPAARSEANYSSWERQVKEWRGPAMAARWARTVGSKGEATHVDHAAPANAVLQQHGLLGVLDAQAYTLSDLLAAKRAMTTAATRQRSDRMMTGVPHSVVAQAMPCTDGNEFVISQLKDTCTLTLRGLPRVLEEEGVSAKAKL